MERTRKHLLATALALAAALILAVPALAADTSEDGYTIVSTADELMAELSKGTQKIRFGNNIDIRLLNLSGADRPLPVHLPHRLLGLGEGAAAHPLAQLRA